MIADLKKNTETKMQKSVESFKADKKYNSGFYVNFIFESDPSGIAQLRKHLAMNDEVFRALFTIAPPPKDAAKK